MSQPALRAEVRFATLAGMLRARAAERPDQVAFTFLADGEVEAERLTYAEIDRRASAVAAALRESVPPGERALLLYPSGLEFIAAFFGCLYAGVVAVPAYPPRPNDRSQSRLRAIARDAEPRVALTTSQILEGSRGSLGAVPELAAARWIPTDALERSAADSFPEPDPQALAFLQYTSGSTADPKGVMVTHANLLHNERMIGAAFGMNEESVVVGWLPLYHDMGLIGNVLQPLHAGARCVLMSPVAFLQRPMRWLEAISLHRGTTSGGPNFAYELCLRKADPEILAGLDLASWRVAFNGAEPVRASTLERFAAAFAPCGFRPEAFHPCYGLAEATLFVTGGEPGTGPRIAGSRVSCGRPWMGQRLAIADPETGVELPAGAEGEVWIAGPSVARGYWKNDEATARDFNAFLETGEGPFLRTGDLGVLDGGELFVTGRIKDLVILRGRNLYPQDVELTAERSHPDLRPGNGAAFSVDIGGEERLVVVHEVERRRRGAFEEVAEAVRRAVAEEHEAQVHEVVLIRTAGLPKTSSGKVQRGLCRRLYLTDGLPVVSRSALAVADPAPAAPALTRGGLAALEPEERREMLAAYLRERAAAVLGMPASEVSPAQALTGLGLDSLTAVELKGSVDAALGLPLPLAGLLRGAGIAELAEEMLAGLDMAPVTDAPPPRPLPLSGDLPLSPGQKALWFLERLAPEAGAYNIVVAARVREGLDAEALGRAVTLLAARHETLRTVIRSVEGEPVQRVVAALEPDVRRVDAVGWGDGELRGRLEAEAWRPFDLQAGPPVRLRIYERAGGERLLLLAVHHLVCDFWSLAVAARELAALYAQETGGPRAALEPPALRYSDFVHWQADRLAGPRGDELRDYWSGALAGVQDLDLPTDRSRPAVQTWRGSSRSLRLPPELVDGLRSLAASQSATLFMALLAAFEVQLGRTARQDDFAVGVPTSGRGAPELAGVLGYFVNPVALRADLSGDPSYRDLLDRVRRTTLEGLERADLPFPWVAERLRPVRDPARSPVFQVVFAPQRGRAADDPGLPAFSLGEGEGRISLGGLTLESVRLRERRALFELTLFAAETPEGGLLFSLEHNADLFDPATVERRLGHWRTLLEGIAADPAVPLSRLPLLTGPEVQQVFVEWNDTGAGFPGGLCLHHLVAAQAVRTPEAVAVVGERERLTYGELMERAGRFARFLRGLGVGPETRVGFCLERTPEMIAAMLGILQAGGAYLPLDPSYPRERLEVILTDGGAAVLLTESSLVERLPVFSGPVVLLDQDRERIEAAPEPTGPAPEPSERNLAYIIYTSGSTGRPKGVAIEHRNAVTLVHWGLETYPREALQVSLAATSVCFDISVFEIFAPLAAGGRLIVVPNVLALRHLAAEELTIVNAVPSPMAELADGPFPASLRVVNLGGEPLKPELVERLYAHPQVERVYNLYGPSEDTTYSTVLQVPKGASAVTIGRPVANTQARVLGRHGELLPAGVPGELFLGGAGVSRGYLGRPDVTAERYVPDPFGPPGSRMYRTGDRVRLLPDGQLDYLGRLDYQVKLHGVRIELGEIEAVLERHPSVRQAVAAVRTDDGADARLVAYVVPEEEAGEDLSADLAAYLRDILPAAMVPTVWVVLPALPLSPNGKVDRRALPAPSRAGHAGAVAPRNASEEMLAEIFRDVLGVEELGVHDDFFELGGHSLMAIRAAFRISEAFATEVAVSALFQAPTVAEMAEWLESVRPEVEEAAPIRRVPREPGWALPASFAQRRLWFLDRLEPGNAAYNLPGWLRLSGPLDLPALAASLAEIARRHEVLRTVLRAEEGEPMQVAGPAGMPLPLVDLGGLSTVEAPAEAERLAREAAGLPFDLARGPLHRALAVRLGPEEHALLLTLHHVVADAWSLGVLFRELAALYEAFAAGRPSPLPELPVQYADYAVWQRERLQGGVLESQLAWWRERLAGAPALELPADRPRLTARSFRGGVRKVALPGEIAEAAGEIARREGATPFMVLLAAFQAQLARYTRDEWVTVGSPVAHRDRSELEGLIGFFVNALALRTAVGDDPTFLGLLARVREVCLGAYAHQEVPFERLVEELRPERQLARNPLFQVVFVLEEPLPPPRLGGLAAEPRPVDTGTAKFDFTLAVEPGPEAWNVRLEYDSDLFDPATADRMLGHWRTLLEGIAADPSAPLSRLPLLTRPERQQVFTEWSDTGAAFPGGLCLHHLVAAQAARTPEAVAVVGERERLTYGELMERAGRFARFLRGLGVGPETRVGFCLQRTPEMIAAMLGILQAGGAYLPLDPSYPRERLEVILTDGGAAVLLTESSLVDRLPAFSGPVVLLDRDRERIEAAPEPAGPAPEPSERNLAYIIYTSGSTGRPKGVAIEHRNAVTLVHWGLETYPREALRVSLAATSVCFDISVFEIFAPLAAGGRLIVVPNVLSLRHLAAEELTIVNAVPSPMAELAGGPFPASLRVVNLGGEPLKAELVERLYAHPQVERVYNLYGPSEDTTYSTVLRVPKGTSAVTIGRPVANTQARVLGRHGELLPAGVPGELFLGGAGVSRGYLGRPEVTAERYVPDPFGPPGARMYRTGDRVRLLPDGQLDYLGRLDYQVKLHGVRIELGEIEAVLEAHPLVRQAVAAVRTDDGPDARLVAYVVPEAAAEDAGEGLQAELASYLRDILPSAMVPTAWVVLPALPLSPNGKVDRRALPAPSRAGHAGAVAPRNASEKILAGIFREALGVEELGVHDDFFELGGHSLMAIRAAFRISEAFAAEVPVSALFQAPTVADMAEWLESVRADAFRAPVPAAPPDGPYPLSFAQQRLWFLDHLHPGSALYNISIPLRLEGRLDVTLLGRALAEILRRHEPLHTVYALVAGEPVQVVPPPPAEPSLPRLSLAGLLEPARRSELLAVLDAAERLAFDLERGPVARFLLVELGPEEHVLAATFHHIATDGWSMGVFSRELTAVYAAFAAGRPSPLPELPLRYVDHALAQRRALADGLLGRQMDYWRSQLAGIPVLELPADHPRPLQPSSRGGGRRIDLPAGVTAALEAAGRAEGITPFMVLLAGFAAFLARTSGQDDFGIGVPSAGRNRAETREMIGLFVNTLVLRPGTGGDPSFLELARRVRDTMVAAQGHQDAPFEKVVEELHPERNPAVSPLFQVLFNFLNDPETSLGIPGLSVSLVELALTLAKFDLTLSLHEWKGSLIGWLEYRTDLFEPSTAERMAGWLATLLARAAAEPGLRLSELPLLTAAERLQLQEWSGGEPVTAAGVCVHQLFEERVRLAPDDPALISDEGTVSFESLDARANRLARHLLALGLAPEARVAVCLERSPGLFVALLAVLKAGGAYLPLDPDYPPERIRQIVEDAGAALLVSREALASRLPAGPVQVLLDRDAGEIAGRRKASPGVEVDPGALAYVIYTSGSTGRPKGVGVPHAAAAAHLQAIRREYGLGPGDRTLQFASPGFDVSLEQILATLTAGAALAVRDGIWSAHELTRRIRELGLTYVNLPTAFWHRWVSDPGDPETASLPLRLVLAGGEEMLAGSVRVWAASPLAGVRLLNGYGPTEAVVTATLHPVGPADGEARTVPIGRPVPGRSCRVLDRAGNPQPAGVSGELALGGPLARGYLNRPALTAERFVPDPFSGQPGARLYRTGDRACFRRDGRLEFHGRVDEQVKVRGFRVEPAEIEALLTGHPGVREAVVTTFRTSGGDLALAAYVVPSGEGEALAASLRGFLSERLPGFMVPAAWTVLPSLPLNAHGKVDRRALPAPQPAAAGGSGADAPVTLAGELLAGLFADLLGRQRVGADESFFELGGHSLLATQLVSRVRTVFGVELPLAAVFERPTPAALADLLDASRRAPVSPSGEPHLVREPGATAPLSFAQRRLWFLHQLEPDDAYNVPGALRLRGSLREDVLERTLEEVVRRHEALRTTFGPGDGDPVQTVLPPAGPRLLPVADLSALPAAAREAEAAKLLRLEAGRTFDLSRGPLLRLLLLRLSSEERLLAVVVHHIVSDAWSTGVLLREVSALYAAFAAGRPSPLPELPVQYPDFARWQRRWLSGERLERQVAHWRRTLAGAPESLELPYDRPPGAAAGTRGGRRPAELPAGLYRPLVALARQEGWTAFMALLAGFQALLARYSGQTDVVAGSPIANRNRLELEGLIGFFTNTLALRVDLAGDPDFREIGRRVRAAALDAYAHQDLPFEKLVEELSPDRQAGRNPIFQTVLVLQRLPAAPALPGVETELVEVATGAAKFDLTLLLTEDGNGASGVLEYARDLFDGTTAERLLGHLRNLLAGAVEDPGRRLSELPLLTAHEHQQVFEEWNDTRMTRAPEGLCLHHLVAAQARRTPDAVAVVGERETLTYRGLTERAGRLARFLRGLGVGPEARVGLCVERTPDMIVAMLGILEAGGAYLPLDPAYPRERVELMLADGGAAALVTESALAGDLPAFAGPVVLLDKDRERIDAAVEPPDATSEADETNLAYVIFTSGSTGRPKGVAIEHRSAVTLVGWGLETFPPGSLEASLAATSICFDISVFEIFVPLATGGRLIVVPNVLALPELAEEVTIVNAVPSPMAEVAGGPFPARLRVVNLGGEPLKPDLVDRIYAHPQVERVYNLYGPTEDTTYSTFLRVPRGASRVTVGRPVADTQARVLGRSGELLPAGVPGELFLSGGGLSRGYLGRPELTAERFLPDPHGPPGARMYRTGDRIRLLPDGQLDYLGRFDHQVKIRGFRIELGEIESALERHPAVRQAVAVVRTDGPLGARLVGYVAPEEPTDEDLPAVLAAYLREILPDVMIPTVWMVLPALPLSPNGKVDRRALPDPERPDSAGAGAPRTPAEERMAAIWSEVLGVAGVGADDDFFDLGGHSLLATQVASRVQEAFGAHLPLRRMFEASTLAAMTAAALGSMGAGAPPPPIRRAPRDGDLPLSFAQERLWLIDRLQPGGSAYNIPLSLLAEGRLDVARLAAALSGLACRHEVLRTVFAERGGAPVQVVLPEADVPLPVIDLAGLPEERREPEARRLAAGEAARPFDLARGPLLRGLLIELDPRRSWLLLSLHHIVADGWSMGVLVREVKALYAGSPLPELPVQYADFAVWQRGWLEGEVLEGQLAWWRERLRGVPSTLELPLDRPRPPLPSARGGEHAFALDGGLSRDLAGLAHREGVTTFMVLAAGLFALLSRLAGQSDLAFGSPIANRHHLETEGLIGFFVNTLVLRADLSRAGGFQDLLRQVREITLGAYAHQDLPFEKLVDELQPERDLTRSPFFQVVLALQNAPLPRTDLGEARLTPQETPTGFAKFDLTFLFAEEEDGRLTCLLQYASDLFDPPTVVRYARHLATLLEDLAARPQGRLAAASLLTGEERQQILREWNDTRREWEGDPALHQLFERQADLRPEALAAISGGETVTYGELEARANRLAHYLRRLGVRRGEPVGLWMARSLDLLTAVLGILKSGAVYVPLDAGWPAERVETILSGTGTRVLVAGRDFAADSLECVVYLIDPTLAAAPAERPAPWAGPDDPAYLIHTSGSTGVPKGIIVRHRSAVNTLRWNNETLEIGPGDRHLFVNSISFDLSIYDMLGMLGAGATVRVAAEDELRDPERLAGILRHEGITTWNSAPVALQQLVPFFPPPGEGRSLRRVFLAGDWIPLSLPDLVRTAFPGVVIGNFGGATETSVWSNWFRVDEVDPSWAGIPYGRPLQNTRYYVLDGALSPCPPGVPGDNHIGGGCLAFGYAGQPALTAERFIPDPFADEPGSRMYATGDRARFRPDGTMEFLGRVDHQVKVRGYRIELGEIEAALARHPGVREAVALAREDVPGEKRLVAYVVLSGRPAPETEELREALARTLPEYMVPWTYVFLDALPVTANGKLDRRALPAPGAAGAGEIEYVAPRNELEKAVAAAWREVLGVERVGVHDNFFETGGSSLLIVKLHARLKETLGLDIPVMELFRHSTVDALARKLAEEEPAAQEARTGEIRERAKTRQDALRQLRQARSERKPR